MTRALIGLLAALVATPALAETHLRCRVESPGNLTPAAAEAEIAHAFRIDDQGFWSRWDPVAGAWADAGCLSPAWFACTVRPLYFELREQRPDGVTASTRIDRAGGRIVYFLDASQAFERWRGIPSARAWGRCDPVPPPPAPRRRF